MNKKVLVAATAVCLAAVSFYAGRTWESNYGPVKCQEDTIIVVKVRKRDAPVLNPAGGRWHWVLSNKKAGSSPKKMENMEDKPMIIESVPVPTDAY